VSEGPGLIVLFGSGETSASGRKVFDWLLRRLPSPARVAILETPAGFELNSAQVAGRIGGFLRQRLQNHRPQITIVPARKRGTAFSPDDPDISALIPGSDAVFLGPGSPTYAVRQLQDSLAWHTVVASQRQGAAVVLASAATVAVGRHVLPVYEIYKAGEDPHWREGLDFFGAYGLSLVFVSHWNNKDGGVELDTSRCYMGQARFGPMLDMLPSDVTVVGIDEHTALVFDLATATCRVLGRDGITLLRAGKERLFRRGASFPMGELGPFCSPELRAGLPAEVWERVQAARVLARADVPTVQTGEVLVLVEQRERARAARDWSAADTLRERIADMGWQVLDTPDGPRLEPVRAGSQSC